MFKNVKNLTRDVVVGVFLIVVGVFSFPVGVGGRGRGFLDTPIPWTAGVVELEMNTMAGAIYQPIRCEKAGTPSTRL